MINPQFFYDSLLAHGTNFFAGVPDSLLKDFCAYITDNAPKSSHIIAANEGCAVGLAVGHHLATGTVPLVYMQNSGLGNSVNPLMSLADKDVYSVPLVLVAGWRGMPGIHDEPQHVKQGKVTLALLDAMRIPYVIMADNQDELIKQIEYCYSCVQTNCSPFAFVVKKGTFSPYKLKSNREVIADMTREEAIGHILSLSPDGAVFVSTTGMASRELFELREGRGEGHEKDFLTVGGMGHASQIALGISLSKPNRTVICLDGDGAAIMHLGGMTTIGTSHASNMVHIVLNNGAHDSVGGQPTAALDIDLCAAAKAFGYEKISRVKTAEELRSSLAASFDSGARALSFIEVRIKKGARANLGRPTTTALENKKSLMEFLK